MISEQINGIRDRINAVCSRIGRNPNEVNLVGISKTVGPEIINEAYSSGLKDLGENKVQELLKKKDLLPEDIRWHFVGHLQRNKVKDIVKFVHLIHSVDSFALANEISKCALAINRTVPILIEVKTSDEATKFGIKPEETINLIKQISTISNLKIMGLMTIGPFVEDPELARPSFKLLKDLSNEVFKLGIETVEMKHLSMGMTNDFEIAIEEGATIIRIGTAIFGSRKK